VSADQRISSLEAQRQALLQVAAHALQGATPHQLMHQAISTFAAGLSADLAAILVQSGNSHVMRVEASFGHPPSLDPRTIAVELTCGHVVGRAGLTGEVVAVADYAGQDEFRPHRNLQKAKIHSSLAVPIPGDMTPAGVVAFHVRKPRQWNTDDIEYAAALAAVLGVALAHGDVGGPLALHQRFTAALLDHLSDMVLACDAAGGVTVWNRAMSAFAGDPTSLPKNAVDWGDSWRWSTARGSPVPRAQMPLTRAFDGEIVHDAEYVVAAPGRPERIVLADCSQVRDTDGSVMGAVLVLHDVTEDRAAQSRLAFHHLHDELTGLANRELFVDRTARALQRARRHGWASAVLDLDLDNFAAVNARVGRPTGDRVLAEVAQRLKGAVRPSDTVARRADLVARLAADEFLILCEDVGIAGEAEQIAQRVAEVVAVPIRIGGHTVTLSARIGLSVVTEHGSTAEEVIAEAEAALRVATRNGPGQRRTFRAEMRHEQSERDKTLMDLERALATGQLRLAYQPQMSLATGLVVGVEALIRWEHPERGLVPPLEFIPLAEESDLIVPIGAWVLQQACSDARRWHQAFPDRPPLAVSVNVSARQFSVGLTDVLREAIRRTGVNPETICVELTETSVMSDPEQAAVALADLRSLGIRVSIDDFGTGYSSLAYLRRFPLNELKIDRSFVDGLGRDPEATAIVAAVMAMAHALDLTVVAEGVETADQLHALRGLGCDQAQGFLFARPMWAADIDEIAARGGVLTAEGDPDRDRGTDSGAAQRGAAGTVVVVDDAAETRMIARFSLTASGFSVHESGGGLAALALIRAVRPDCVLMDLNMPEIGGLEMCRLVRDDSTIADTTIVMLSAEGQATEKASAFTLNVDDYIVKPFNPRDLVNRVAAAIRRRSERNPSVRPAPR
jgi:diguanylate cyclase (GGDEF)-like protein